MGYLDDAINKARQGKAPGERPKGNTHAHSSPDSSMPALPEATPAAESPAESASVNSGASPVVSPSSDASTMASAIAWLTQQETSDTTNEVAPLSPQELAMQLAPAGSSTDPIQVVEDLAQSLPSVQATEAAAEMPPAVLPQVPPPVAPVPPAVSLAKLVDSLPVAKPVESAPPAKTSNKKPFKASAKAKTASVASPSVQPEPPVSPVAVESAAPVQSAVSSDLPVVATPTVSPSTAAAAEPTSMQSHEPSAAHLAQTVLGQAPGLPTRAAESDANARDERLVILDDPASIMAEEYRSIRTSLLARWQNKRHLVHTITSATPQEGKTITSLNLGLCLAELRNRRTIVVEVDLRLPQYDRLLALKPGPGLVGYLEGKADLNQIIQQLAESPLHVIAAGGNAGNSAVQLVSSPQMADLIKTLREHYDHVIIDTPPVVELADAGILGAMSDDVLLIVRMQMTPKPLVEQAIRTLASYNAPVGGLIATDQHHHRGGYYYKYGYRYGYGRYYHYHSKKKPHRD